MDHLDIGGEFQELTLSNGLTVWLVRDVAQSVARGTVVVRAGAKDSPDTGIAHYFEHMMFKGTTTIGTTDYESEKLLLDKIADEYTLLGKAGSQSERDRIQQNINKLNIEASSYSIPNDFSNLISKYGGNGLNAGTSYDYTVYYNSFRPEYLAHWCSLYSERLVAPVFRLFQSELETVYEEKNMLSNDPFSSATQRVFERVFAPHPYRHPIIGSTEALKNPDLHAMQQFFETYYTAGNMAVILSGDLPGESQIVPLLEQTFGRIKPGKPVRPIHEQPNRFKGKETFEIKHPVPALNMIGTLWHAVPNNHPDLLPLQLINALLNNNGKTGLLDQVVLNRHATMATASCLSFNDCGFFGILIIPKIAPFARRKAEHEVQKAISQIRSGSFSDELFSQAKLSLLRSQYEIFETPKARQTYLQNLFASYATIEDTKHELDRLEAMSREEVVKIAQKYLGEDRLRVTKKTGRYAYEPLQKPPYDPVTNTQSGAQSPFGKKLEGLPIHAGKVPTLDLSQDKDATLMSSRPLRTLYHTVYPANGLFRLTFTFYRGVYHHPIQDLLAPYLDQVGGGGMKAKEFYDHLYRYGTTLTFDTADYYFTATLKGYDKYFKESTTLLADYLRDVERSRGALKEARHELKLSDETNKNTPETIGAWLSSRVRYGAKAGYLQTLSPKEAKKITLDDLQEELHALLKSEADIHYSGTLDKQAVLEEVGKVLPHLEESSYPAEPFIYLEAKPITTPQIYILHEPEASQSIIRTYLALGTMTPQEKKQAIFFANYLGGGMGSVLFQEIREYRSLAYSVWCRLIISKPIDPDHTSHLLIGMGTQHDKAASAIQLLTELLSNLPLTDERLENARHNLRSSAAGLYPTERQKSARIAYLLRSGYTVDMAKELLAVSEQVGMDGLCSFYKEKVAHRPLIHTIVGNTKVMDLESLKQHYTLREVSRKELLDDRFIMPDA